MNISFRAIEFYEMLDSKPGNRWTATISSSLNSLERTYAGGLTCYLALERIGLRSRFHAPVPTISVGNLSVGGTGKSPATIAIGKSLQSIGYRVAVLSRGHGGSSSRSAGVVSNQYGQILMDVSQSGDEPMMLARALTGIPVLVGKDRRITAKMAIELFQPDLLILDDGFQYWQMMRDVDIVLLDASKPFENGHCLPRGLLREPKKNLSRAQIVIVTRSGDLSSLEKDKLVFEIKELAPQAFTFFAKHQPDGIAPRNFLASAAIDRPKAPLVVSAIAKPESFLLTVKNSGLIPSGTMTFDDHHSYTAKDAKKITDTMKEVKADAVITTEKDAVKLEHLLPGVPLFAQTIKFEVLQPNDFMSRLLSIVQLSPLPTLGLAAIC